MGDMRIFLAALAVIALVVGGCMEDNPQPVPPPDQASGTTYDPRPQDSAVPPPDDQSSYGSPQSGESTEEDPDAIMTRAQQRGIAADSIARQLQAATPANQDWSALDASFIEDFVQELCAGDPEPAAHRLMKGGVPNADLRAAPGLTQAVFLASQECPRDRVSVNRASNVMNRYLVAGQRKSDYTARQLAAATPAAPNFVESLLGTICKGTVRRVSVKSGAGFLFGLAAGAAVCPDILDEFFSF